MADDQNILALLDHFGHTRTTDLDKKNAKNIKKSDISRGIIKLEDNDAKDVVRSYQEWFKPRLDELALKHHGRAEADIDGNVGPAFIELLQEHEHGGRCGCPEFATEADDPLYKEEANWPDDCRGNLKINKSFSKLPGLSKEDTDRVWIACANIATHAYTDMGVKYEPDLGREYCDVYADLKALPGSTLAWNYLAQNNCRVTLQAAYDNTISWSLNLATATASHEHHHGWGHNHVRDSRALMYPSINSSAKSRWGYPNSTDLSQARNLGYETNPNAEPLDNTDEELFNPNLFTTTPTPGPTPTPPSENIFRNTYIMHQGKKYIIIPYIEF